MVLLIEPQPFFTADFVCIEVHDRESLILSYYRYVGFMGEKDH